MPKRKTRKGNRTVSASGPASVESDSAATSDLASNQAHDRLDSVSDVDGCDSLPVLSGNGSGCEEPVEPAVKKLKSAAAEEESVLDSSLVEDSVEETGDEGVNDGDVGVSGEDVGVSSQDEVVEVVNGENGLETEQNDDSDMSDGGSDGEESDYEEYMDADEIDALLDQGMVNYKKRASSDQSEPVEKEKVVLIEKVSNPFEVMPDGWVVVSHNSGMPLFLHKETRVCTLSKPYFLGSGSARKHAIPVSAIPCLEYRRAVEKEKEDLAKKDEEVPESLEGVEKSDAEKPQPTAAPSVEVKLAEDHHKETSLEPEEMRKYCEKIFQFKTIKFKRYNTWKERRINMKKEKRKSRPVLPSTTTLITCPMPSGANEKSNRKKEFFMNPDGKTPVCLLHEYVQRVMRQQPKYTYKDTEMANTPYSANVVINDIEYGFGYAANKKQAKQEAAKKALSVLLPDVKEFGDQTDSNSTDLSFFEEIKIEDPRVKDLCVRIGQSGPFTILLECLKRNYGLGNTDVKIEMTTLKNQRCEYTMTAGKHTTTVICKNKRDGKQQAAQALLQLLHPHFNNWGSLLRLYGKSTVKMEQEKKDAEVQVGLPVSATQDSSVQVESIITVPPTVQDHATQVFPPSVCDVAIQIGCRKMSDAFSQARPPIRLVQSRVFKHIIPPVAPPVKREASSQCFTYLQDRSTQITDDADFLGDCWCISRQLKVHHVTQTEWIGVKYFHKATQEPEQTNVIQTSRGSNYSTVSHLGMEDKVTETDWTGSSMFHKATQFPDVTYSSEDKSKEIVVTKPPLAVTRPTSPSWGQRLPPFSSHSQPPQPQYPVRPQQSAPIRYQMPFQMMQAPMYSSPYMYPYQYYPSMYLPQQQQQQQQQQAGPEGYQQEAPNGQ